MFHTNINLVLFGNGNVGNTLVKQLREASGFIQSSLNLKLNLIGLADSNKFQFNPNGIVNAKGKIIEIEDYHLNDMIQLLQLHQMENLIAIDATASHTLSSSYKFLISNGFHIVAANKIANTDSQKNYNELREALHKYDKSFRYETNVGAGLPVIETVKGLYECGDEITKIRGVFSGSLSYIFNTFCKADISFSAVVRDALKLGYTEPDPRIDLSGKDVARKLLILAREVGISFELEEVKIRSLLIPNLDEQSSLNWFLRNLSELDEPFETAKITQKPNYVLRYIGELNVKNKTLEVKLVSEPENSSLGQLKGTDSLFEIYTTSYGEEPLVIRGAGAGKEVTARGLLSDVIKIAKATVITKKIDVF
ncbi:aspartate kinase [Ascidiimonas sp. W6]|uniref:aspartate kinase n=1 Tax=Ascidiimonas meishanensis TaxID=3128903 RepID=UPI0030EF1AE8